MNNRIDHIKGVMAEVLRLTLDGRLSEATAVIQRTLGDKLHKSKAGESHESSGTTEEAIEVEYLILDEKPTYYDTSEQDQIHGAAKPAKGRLAELLFEGWKTPESRHTTKKPKVTPGVPLSSVRAKGRLIDGSFTNTAGTRTYKLYIPGTYVGHEPLPLVVMLHGCTQSPADFAAGTRMNELAEKEQFFVVYPEQSQNANASKCWNWFETANQLRSEGEPSLIAGITQKIMSKYRISAGRVYVVGMSAGGAMAAIMAVTYPEIYAAVGVHSGLPYGAAHDLPSGFESMQKGASRHRRQLSRAIPLIMFHGDRDKTVAKINADLTRDQWIQAFDRSGRPVVGPAVERGKVGGHRYTRFIYQDTDGQVLLEEWVIHHAGHAWSGGSSEGSFTSSKGPDASAEMVRFLWRHSRDN